MKSMPSSPRFILGSVIALCILIGMMVLSKALANGPPPADQEHSASVGCCRIIELRQYLLKPGQRDALVALFDRHFIETQEADGMRILGQFTDEDEPDHFVWLRGFTDMPARQWGLTAFYSGPTWKQFGKQAAGTMIDSDNVLLLRPVDPAGGFDDLPSVRPPIGALAPPAFVLATIYHLRPSTATAFPAFFLTTILPALRIAGITPRATFETEPTPNNYPALPIREGENVFVWFASFENPLAYADSMDRLAGSTEWNRVKSELQNFLDAPPAALRLTPTGRSLLR